jgi:Icc protein
MKKTLPWLFLAMILFSCKGLFQYSPNEVRLEDEEKNLNAKNIAKLSSMPAKQEFRFAVIGDSQRFYDEVEDFVDSINKRDDISFVLLNGDITDFGLNREYRWINNIMKRLKVPYISVIGNHDMIANGRKVYTEMFGPDNFSFEYSGCKFVCLNTNSMEVGKDGSIPDLPWLQSQLSNRSAYRNAFVFGHMSPQDEEFDETKSEAYSSMLADADVPLSIHGHQHKFSRKPDPKGFEYLVVASMEKRSYAIVTVNDNDYHIEEKNF